MRSETAQRGVLVFLMSMLAGAANGFVSVAGFSWVVMGEPPESAFLWGIFVGGGGGFLLGTISSAYLVPLLTNTQLAKSATLVYGSALACSAVPGLLHPTIGCIAAFGAHLVTGVLAHRFWRILYPEERGLYCYYCGYEIGCAEARCSECGRNNVAAAWHREWSGRHERSARHGINLDRQPTEEM